MSIDIEVGVETMTVELSPKVRPVLDSVAGETLDQKIARLLLGEIRHHLEACERERLELEIKYGLEYVDFRRKLEAGELGDEFGYALEVDALKWEDLIAEKKYWLQQLSLLKGLLK
jgi:hypothetical protein